MLRRARRAAERTDPGATASPAHTRCRCIAGRGAPVPGALARAGPSEEAPPWARGRPHPTSRSRTHPPAGSPPARHHLSAGALRPWPQGPWAFAAVQCAAAASSARPASACPRCAAIRRPPRSHPLPLHRGEGGAGPGRPGTRWAIQGGAAVPKAVVSKCMPQRTPTQLNAALARFLRSSTSPPSFSSFHASAMLAAATLLLLLPPPLLLHTFLRRSSCSTYSSPWRPHMSRTCSPCCCPPSSFP